MIRRPPVPPRTYTLFPYPTLFRSWWWRAATSRVGESLGKNAAAAPHRAGAVAKKAARVAPEVAMPALSTELEARGHGPLLREKRGREAPRRPCPIGQRVRLIQIKLASVGLHDNMRARIKGVA